VQRRGRQGSRRPFGEEDEEAAAWSGDDGGVEPDPDLDRERGRERWGNGAMG
jgi:hypothetical protein